MPRISKQSLEHHRLRLTLSPGLRSPIYTWTKVVSMAVDRPQLGLVVGGPFSADATCIDARLIGDDLARWSIVSELNVIDRHQEMVVILAAIKDAYATAEVAIRSSKPGRQGKFAASKISGTLDRASVPDGEAIALMKWFVPLEQDGALARYFSFKVESGGCISHDLFHRMTDCVKFLALQPNQAARYFEFRFTPVLTILELLANFYLNCSQICVHFSSVGRIIHRILATNCRGVLHILAQYGECYSISGSAPDPRHPSARRSTSNTPGSGQATAGNEQNFTS